MSAAVAASRNSITGIVCCARAASGHAAAAPPSSVMNSRRFIVDSLDNLIVDSLDNLIGELLKMQGHVEAKRLGGLQVDDQLELGG